MSKKRTPAKQASPTAALENELRLLVKQAVQQVTPDAYPAVAGRLTDVEGYRQVEDAVINVSLRNTITPSAALALLESEWGGIA